MDTNDKVFATGAYVELTIPAQEPKEWSEEDLQPSLEGFLSNLEAYIGTKYARFYKGYRVIIVKDCGNPRIKLNVEIDAERE